MSSFDAREKDYEVDRVGFLLDSAKWDAAFAESRAALVKIPSGLTREHWEVIDYIREEYSHEGICPTVYRTCRECNLRLKELRRLFLTGYLRGACLLAGITYRNSRPAGVDQFATAADLNTIAQQKIYETDVRGFLVYPDEWDECFAIFRAHDMKIPGGRLTERHWDVIRFLRDRYAKTRVVPSIYETCEGIGISLDDLETLFPDGYHRGAVKIAGLRVL